MQQRELFTADTHFRHPQVIKHCKRPFISCEEMDEEMVRRWNDTVRKSDTVIHAGDFAISRSKEDDEAIIDIFSRLNGRKFLVPGNHCLKTPVVLNLKWAAPPKLRLDIRSHRTTFIISHYPMRTWPGMVGGSIQIYGHHHGRLPGIGNQIDVGVDSFEFRPVTTEEIRARIALQPQPVYMMRNETEPGELDEAPVCRF
jgi:calcineurin-like phosphoesterase family protein